MNWKFLNQPLGMSDMSGGYAPKEKHIAWLVPAIMAATSIGSTIFGAAKSAQANRKAASQVDAERAANNAERIRAKHENYQDTAAGQNLIRVAKDQAKKIYDQAEGAAAVAGGTEASKQMAKDAGNQMVGEAVANIAANDTARKDNLDASYRATDRQLAQQQISLEQQRGQNIANAASQIGSTLMSAATSYLGTNFGAGSPGGGGVAASTGKLANMGGGNFDFKDYANNYVKNMYLPETSPLFSTDYRQFFNLG